MKVNNIGDLKCLMVVCGVPWKIIVSKKIL